MRGPCAVQVVCPREWALLILREERPLQGGPEATVLQSLNLQTTWESPP